MTPVKSSSPSPAPGSDLLSLRLTRLEFAAGVSYASHPVDEAGRQSRDLTIALKQGKEIGSPPQAAQVWFVSYIKKNILGRIEFSRFLNPAAVLVPVPRSSMQRPGSLWVPDQLANALVEAGLGARVARLLKRTEPIPKAAWSPSSERDALRNFQTLAIQRDFLPTPEILLVDDVVVTGSSLLGSANRLLASYASVPIKGFAAVRTMTDPADFRGFNSPETGTITLKSNGLCQRVP